MRPFLFALATLGLSPLIFAAAETKIPVIADVDVLVVGGSTAAVAAAQAAARAHASVYLMAPAPYLGEDLCATMRVFLEKDDAAHLPQSPDFFKKIFDRAAAAAALDAEKQVYFTYAPHEKTAFSHEEPIYPVLTDGTVTANPGSALQFKGNRVTVDLFPDKDGTPAALAVYALKKNKDTSPAAFALQTSADGKTWTPAGEATFDTKINTRSIKGFSLFKATLPLAKAAPFYRIEVRGTPKSERLILSEIKLLAKDDVADDGAPFRGPVAPLHIKRTLDNALIEAGVPFLYTSRPTDLLRDKDGNIAGVVFGNRSGRQAIAAKVVIDATENALLARLAGAAVPSPKARTLERVVIGALPEGATARDTHLRFPVPPSAGKGEIRIISFPAEFADGDFPALARAEQALRDAAYRDGQNYATAGFLVLPEIAVRPDALPEFLLRAPYAPQRAAAAAAEGALVGKAAAQAAKNRGAAIPIALAQTHTAALPDGETLSHSADSLRDAHLGDARLDDDIRNIPVWADYDVIVVGGGTAGSVAGIAAARTGAKTLIIDVQHSLGGVSTLGLVSKYWWGYKKGFPSQTPDGEKGWNPIARAEWLRRTAREAGADIWFGATVNGALLAADKKTVRGVEVTTAEGRGAVRARAVIDTTGNADIAAAAGAPVVSPGEGEMAIQGTGLPRLILGGARFTNTDYAIADESDIFDLWYLQLYARQKYKSGFDTVPYVASRERRRIVGDFTQGVVDQLNARTYPDTIFIGYSNLDAHGMSADPVLEARHPDRREGITARFPYRVHLPRGFEGLLVGGLGMSVSHDALAVARMQANLQNQGYALGVAAAMAAKNGVSLRDIDVRALQRALVAIDALPASILEENDGYPLPDARFDAAIKTLPNDYEGVFVLFTDPARAVPRLRRAYADAHDPKTKLVYAHTLALLGDNTGVPNLVAALESGAWDKGWNFRGMNNFGATQSPMDSYIMALGRLRAQAALPAILRKAAQLGDSSEFSHYRAIAGALRHLRAKEGAPILSKILAQPGFSGHALTNIESGIRDIPESTIDNTVRAASIRELMLARALLLCGDDAHGTARAILEAYCRDLRGHWARFAEAALAEADAK